jgi:hypothetical protein
MRVHHIVIYCLSGSTIFFHIISNGTISGGKNIIGHDMCVLILSTTFVRNIPHYKKNCARYDKKNVYWSSCKVPLILVRFQWNFNIPDTFSKNTQISNFVKTRPVWADLFHADGQTWRSLYLLFAILRTRLNISEWMAFREITAACCENYFTTDNNTVRGKFRLFVVTPVGTYANQWTLKR